MRIGVAPHRWDVSPRRAVAIQARLAGSVRRQGPERPARWVAGVDAAFSKDGRTCIAGVVVWDRRESAVVEQRVAQRAVRFPYVPGLLSFREAPAVMEALRGLRSAPQVLICDGQGLAHPRRFGLACHVGVITGLQSVGCAKSRLVGRHLEPADRRGSRRRLVDRGEVVGAVLRTRDRIRPVYVSIGHRVDLDAAVRLVLACGAGYRLPEPTRLADQLVARVKREGR